MEVRFEMFASLNIHWIWRGRSVGKDMRAGAEPVVMGAQDVGYMGVREGERRLERLSGARWKECALGPEWKIRLPPGASINERNGCCLHYKYTEISIASIKKHTLFVFLES